MPVLIRDHHLGERILSARRATGLDRGDEVWEGVYVMPPYPNNEHRVFQANLVAILQVAVGWRGLGEVCGGVNVNDRKVNWMQNYRCPGAGVRHVA